jgi:hypothetical protein
VLLLGACYAELDWREVVSSEGGFSVLLPARVRVESRPLSGIAGNPVMHLWSAKTADTLFGAGYADLAAGDAAALANLRDGMVRNLQGKIVSDRDVRAGTIAGREFLAEGLIGGAPAAMRLRLLVSGARVYQLVAIGRAGAVTPEELDMFFESFRLRAPQS